MYDRIQELSPEDLAQLHQASLALLADPGIVFNDDQAVEIFASRGFRVEGRKVFFSEAQISAALETCPRRFMVQARDPEKCVSVGEDDFVLVPGYGAPFVTGPDGLQRQATLADYDDFCRLVQTSPVLDMNGFMMVEPHDVPADTAHLDMLLSSILLSDKPFMGSPINRQGARDCLEMLKLVWGWKEGEEQTCTVSLINSLSPFQFSEEMAGSLIELARANQAVVVAALIMAGSSGPVTLPGVLAMQNAEILAGITLAQLVRPGCPVIYGSTSSAMDMRSGALSIGAPELSVVISATAQMARFYGLPSRSGGALTDALAPDAQAGAESALALSTAARSGINFILHAAGILGSYISMSFEKFLIDEEMAGMIKKIIKPLAINSETIALETMQKVGIGGQYLTQPKTFQLCRTEFYLPRLMNRATYDAWSAGGRKRIDQEASAKLEARLAAYEQPRIDPGLEKALKGFVQDRKRG